MEREWETCDNCAGQEGWIVDGDLGEVWEDCHYCDGQGGWEVEVAEPWDELFGFDSDDEGGG